MSFLLNNWRWIAVAAFVAIYSLFLYRIGGNGPRAELKAYKAESARLLQEAKDAKEKADAQYKQAIADWQRRWSERVSKPTPTKPVVSRLCNNQQGNDQLAAAVREYLDEIGQIRSEIAAGFADADRQQVALNCVRAWAGR